MASFTASLVTPEQIVLVGVEVDAVMVRTVDGEATFLAGHADVVGALVPGVVRFQPPEGDVERIVVHGGFVQVGGNLVTVLAPVAERVLDIDVERARAAAASAEARLAELGAGSSSAEGEGEGVDGEVLDAQAALARAQLRISSVEGTDAA